MLKTVESTNLVGTYVSEELLMSAIKIIKEKNIKIKNIFTPYPIPEVFHQLELSTRFPYLATLFGFSGMVITFAFLYWTSVIDFPIRVGGKPPLSLSFIVIMFVMTINAGIILSVISFFLRQNLFPGKPPIFGHVGNTDDKYSIVIEIKPDSTEKELSELKLLLTDSGAKYLNEKKNIESI